MTGDYGREVAFGLFPSPGADPESQRTLWAQVFAADRGGLDYIGIQDHPYQRRHMDTWMLMATVLARTERVRVFPDVANLPLRPPAVLATSAASLDVLSEGRFELGLGAGGFWEAIEAMGGPRRSPREAADALMEAIEIIRLMWSGERSVRFHGEHYRVSGAKPGPLPVHEMGLWLGVLGPRLLRELGRKADGWVPSSAFAGPTSWPTNTPASMWARPRPDGTRPRSAASTTCGGASPTVRRPGSWTGPSTSGWTN